MTLKSHKKKDSASSWLVVLAVSLMLFLEQGLIKSFSVLLPDIREQFSTYTWVVGWSISFVFGWGCILGLSTGALVKKSLGRASLIGCGIIGTTGLFICACAGNSLTFLLGLSFCAFFILQHNFAIGAIPEYFDIHFDTAVAIYSCGTGLGITVMPFLAQALRDVYGWRGTLVLLGALCAHVIPCGAMIKIDDEKEAADSEDDAFTVLFPPPPNSQESRPKTGCFKLISTLSESVSELFDLSLLTNTHFLAQVAIPSFVLGFTYNGWLIYVISYALSNGASYRDASLISTSGGIGVTAIRTIIPFLNKLFNFKQLMYMQSVLGAIALLLMTQFDDIKGMAIMSMCFGISFGIFGAEMYIVIHKVTDPLTHFSGVAWHSLLDGLGALTSGFLTGYLFDMTGSFSISFTILAVMYLITAVSFGMVEIWDGIKRAKFAPL